MAITKRILKGSALTHIELDGNFTDLDGRITTLESASDSDSQTLTLAGDDLTITGGNTVSLSTLSTEVVDDTSPQLGGNLDLNGNQITGSGGSAIAEVVNVLTIVGGSNGIIMRTTGSSNITIGDQAGDVVLGNSANSVEFVNDVDVDFTNTNVDFTSANVTGLSIVQGIDDLSDVDTSTTPPGVGQVLKWDGAQWEPANDSSGSGGITWASITDINNANGPGNIAIGVFAGSTNQSNSGTAVGAGAGGSNQGSKSVAAGYSAASADQGDEAVAIGDLAGNSAQGNQSVAIGKNAGAVNQNTQSVALGYAAGQNTQGSQAIAIGRNAGALNQSASTVAIGDSAGKTTQGDQAVAIGENAGSTTQGIETVAIGTGAGGKFQHLIGVAVGGGAGQNGQGGYAVAVGGAAGQGTLLVKTYTSHVGTALTVSDTTSIRVGAFVETTGITNGTTVVSIDSGTQVTLSAAPTSTPSGDINFVQNGQAQYAVAVGRFSGQKRQGEAATALGYKAGSGDQGANAVAVGANSGFISQGASAVAIGRDAGKTSQGDDAVAIGTQAGNNTQGSDAVAIGQDAGKTTQGLGATAVGSGAATTNQGASAVALGVIAGLENQGAQAVAIGSGAGFSNQAANSIVLNATGSVLNNTQEDSLVIKPIRNDTMTTILGYNAGTGEVTHNAVIPYPANVGVVWDGVAPTTVDGAIDRLASYTQAFAVSTDAHWADPDPTGITEAINRLAAAVYALNGNTGI